MKVFLLDGSEVEARTVENLGYVHSIGHYARVVEFVGKDITVVKRGRWEQWGPRDRVSGGLASRGVGQ